jgi:predicted alpha/beta superfamily hydrolase
MKSLIAKSRIISVLLLPLLFFTFTSCGRKLVGKGMAETVEIKSRFLSKVMRLSVYLPPNYSKQASYPILYFIPYGGGGPGAITKILMDDTKSLAILESSDYVPFIVVGVPHDGSFLLNSDPPHGQFTGNSGITLTKGYYESFFISEVMPYIEKKYQSHTATIERYIGGYSMGGYAALRIALTYPDLFAKVGAHSPTLFTDSLSDEIASDFMYPDIEARLRRDPLMMDIRTGSISHMQFYIDTGANDINRSACKLMYNRLNEIGVHAEYQILSGSHGIQYLWSHMSEYLAFYGKKAK